MSDFDEMRRLIEDVVLPDYSGFGITRHFGLQKTQQSNSSLNYFIKVRTTAGTPYYIFKDSNGILSGFSKVSTTTTPTSQSFSELISSQPSLIWTVDNLYCNISGLNLAKEGSAAEITLTDVSGNILTEGAGFASIYFNGSKSLSAAAISELNNGNNVSLSFIGANRVDDSSLGVFNTANTDANRFNIYCDRTSGKVAARIRTATNTYDAGLIATTNSGALRRIYITIDGTAKEMKTYLNGVLQTTVTFVGTYVNDIFRLGSFRLNNLGLTGPVLDFKVSTQKWSAGTITSLDAKHVTQFGL